MSVNQAQAFDELASSWVSLALESSDGAVGLSKIFVYAGSEEGSRYANVFFEQSGSVIYANELQGVDVGDDRVFAMKRHLHDHLGDAEARLDECSAPRPTQYRLVYDNVLCQVDLQLSYESVYSRHPTKVMEEGAEDWLDGLLEKKIGR